MSCLRQNKQITCRIQNPDIPRAGRGGPSTAGGGAGRGGAGRDADGSVRPGYNRPSGPPKVGDNCYEQLSGSTNNPNPI